MTGIESGNLFKAGVRSSIGKKGRREEEEEEKAG